MLLPCESQRRRAEVVNPRDGTRERMSDEFLEGDCVCSAIRYQLARPPQGSMVCHNDKSLQVILAIIWKAPSRPA